MKEDSEPQAENITLVPAVPTPKTPREIFRFKMKMRALNVVAALFWVYVLVKLFVFDIDVYALSLVSEKYLWILHYKFPIFLAVIVIAMIAMRSFSLGLAVLYIAFYPFVVLFWKIPYFLWKRQSWLLVFAFINTVISAFRAFKRNFIVMTTIFIASLFILSTGNHAVLYTCATALILILAYSYLLSFIRAFKPSAVFQLYTKVFPSIRTLDIFKIDTAITSSAIDQLNPQQLETRTNSLQNMVLYNRCCLFIAKRLRDYQRSGVNVASYLLGLVLLLLFSVVIFSFVNFAAYKINPSAFLSDAASPTFFSFVYYSAGSMFYATNALSPVTALAQGIQLSQFFSNVLLLVILITVIVTVHNDKYTAQLSEVVEAIEKEGNTVEDVLQSSFNLESVAKAIEALQEAKAGLAGFILYLTRNIDD